MLHKLSEALETEVSFLIDGKEPEEQEEKRQQDPKDRKKKIKLWFLQLVYRTDYFMVYICLAAWMFPLAVSRRKQ